MMLIMLSRSNPSLIAASFTRRGQPCWFRIGPSRHRAPKKRLEAIQHTNQEHRLGTEWKDHQERMSLIRTKADGKSRRPNDGLLLESMINIILRKYFPSNLFVILSRLFDDVKLKTEMGQMLDIDAPTDLAVDSKSFQSFFSLERYQKIVKYKTSYYTFFLPIASAFALSGQDDAPLLRKMEEICLLFGEYFQIQDDFLDCFGNVEQTGKIGTDIEDFKCSWLAVQFLMRASPTQLQTFRQHYGSKEKASVQQIKQLYVELGIKQIFEEYEKTAFEAISGSISQVDHAGLKRVLNNLLHSLFKRSK